MVPTHRLPVLLTVTALLLCACVNPISREAREQVDPAITLAMVSDNPTAWLGRHLLLGGAVVAVENGANGAVLEVMEGRLTRWGAPAGLDEAGRRFLVKTPQKLDPSRYQPGTLVTLTGVVLGRETRSDGENEDAYTVFTLTELHRWEIPFRYGIHRNAAPLYPHFAGHDDESRRNPYDPGYNPYPYTQYQYRNGAF